MKRQLLTILALLATFSGIAEAHYNPRIGRFMSRDPIEEKGGVNTYSFVRNEPINNWDVYGLRTWEEARRDREAMHNRWREGEVIYAPTCKKFKELIEAGRGGEVSRHIGKLWSEINRLSKIPESNCRVPIITCKCNNRRNRKLGDIKGGFISRENQDEVEIFYYNMTGTDELIETFQHELIHAWQKCNQNVKHLKKDCKSTVCNEIQAYLNDGGCQRKVRLGKYTSVRECVIDSAANSSTKRCEGSKEKAAATARELYNKCNKPIPVK